MKPLKHPDDESDPVVAIDESEPRPWEEIEPGRFMPRRIP